MNQAYWLSHLSCRTGVRVFAVVLTIVYFLLTFLGYDQLANVVLVGVLQTAVLALVFYQMHHVTRGVIAFLVKRYYEKRRSQADGKLLIYWSVVAFDLVYLCLFAVALLLIWGVHPDAIIDWVDLVFFKGVQVGETAFSVSYVLKAVIVYLVVYYLSKLIIRLVESKVFPYTRFDESTKSAISTVLGYSGLLLAIVLAVYTLGISSTSLAFIVSAFTFGLSFGLKEIFNNFISGIILFIERPIKVGDWVDVAGESGVVKNIKLRATTVETFSRKTLLIPNAQFITSVISNDLYNPVARGIITIECSYDDEPEKVRDLLLQVAARHQGVMQDPEPSVIFNNFNDSGLEFLLRFFCLTKNRTTIANELRYDIFNAFKEAGIEIPYPKRDVYICSENSKE